MVTIIVVILVKAGDCWVVREFLIGSFLHPSPNYFTSWTALSFCCKLHFGTLVLENPQGAYGFSEKWQEDSKTGFGTGFVLAKQLQHNQSCSG